MLVACEKQCEFVSISFPPCEKYLSSFDLIQKPDLLGEVSPAFELDG